jgi:ubiquinone/menaquinone biosynthesis C-methylase UbiE
LARSRRTCGSNFESDTISEGALGILAIPTLPAYAEEARRVLEPSGRLLLVEHGQPPYAKARRWQNRLTAPETNGRGCHLNREIDQLVEDSGFRIEQMKMGYMKGPKPMTFMYEGSASSA